jgi:hypothetical protein
MVRRLLSGSFCDVCREPSHRSKRNLAAVWGNFSSALNNVRTPFPPKRLSLTLGREQAVSLSSHGSEVAEVLSAITQKDGEFGVGDAVPTTRERQQRRVPFGTELRTMWQQSGTSCGNGLVTVTLRCRLLAALTQRGGTCELGHRGHVSKNSSGSEGAPRRTSQRCQHVGGACGTLRGVAIDNATGFRPKTDLGERSVGAVVGSGFIGA